MSNAGYLPVRELVAHHASLPDVDASRIIMTAGAAGALALALRTFADPGEEVLVLPPYFPEYVGYCRAARLKPVFAPLSNAGPYFDVGRFQEAISGRTRIVLLNTPVNPTGHVLSEQELSTLADTLDETNRRRRRPIVLVVDEVYHRVVFGPAAHLCPLLQHHPTVLARSFSKDFGLAGERLGYLVLDPLFDTRVVVPGIEHWQRALGFVNAPATAQRALLHLADWRVDLQPLRRAREEAYAAFSSAGLDVLMPDAGLYIFARTPTTDSGAFVAALASGGIFVVAGESFGAPGWFRACFARKLEVIRAAGVGVARLLDREAH
jgi:aspartate aminotransferase